MELVKPRRMAPPPKYGLTIYCVDGDTIYASVGRERQQLLGFLSTHDHEGASLELKMERPDGTVKELNDAKLIYEELGRV